MNIFKSDEADLAAKAHSDAQASRALVETLSERVGILARDVTEGEAKAAAAALAIETGTGNAREYDKIAAEVARLKDELARKRRALEAAKQKLSADEIALHRAGTANRRKDAQRLANQRAKAFEEIAAGYAQAYRGWEKVFAVNSKLVNWSPTIALNHAGCLISASEVQRAVETEIARLSSPGVLPAASAVPALPGARTNPLENPATADPLAKAVEAANAEMIRRIVDGPVAVPSEPKASAPAQHDPDDALLNAPAAVPTPAQTFNAAQLMPAARQLKI